MTTRPALAALILAAAFAQAETSEEKLTNARQRKAAAEADIQTYTQQLEQMQQQKAANDTALQQAGERLNAAWQAAHGSR